MIRRLSCFIIVSLLFATATIGQSVVLEDGIEVQLPDSIEISKEQILKYYISQGFLSVQIEENSSGIYRVLRGCSYSIESISIKPEDWDSPVYQRSLSGTYTVERVEAEVERILSGLRLEGYLQAKAEIKNLDVHSETCSLSVLISVERGELTYSSGIFFSGAKSNSQQYLTKVSRYQDSLIISGTSMKRIQAELLGSELFNQVSEGEVFVEDSSHIIVFAVEERSLNRFDGIVGYAPDASGEGQIVGDVEVSLWNVFAEGNAFDIQYERLRPETSRLKLGVSQSWLGNVPLSIGIDFGIFQNDTTYQTRNIGVNASYWLSTGFKITGGISSLTSSSSFDSGIEVEPDGKKQLVNLGFSYSNVNHFDFPTSGFRLMVDFGFAHKDIDTDSALAFSQQQIEGRVENYFSLSRRGVLATSMEGFLVVSDRYTESDLIRFGGANSFRGYAEEQFFASQLLWGNMEYRYQVNPGSYLFGFGAIGGYHRPRLVNEQTNSFQQTDVLYSTGFGISYKTRIGQLTFSYALSPTEDLVNGKVHFGLTTRL